MQSDIGGVWRTIGGRRVFIKDGQSLESAMRESGKFKNKNDSKKSSYYKEIQNATTEDEMQRILREHDSVKTNTREESIIFQKEWNKRIKEIRDYENYKKNYDYKKEMPTGAKFSRMLEEEHVRTFADDIELNDMSKMSYREIEKYDRENSYKASDNAIYARARILYYETGLEKYKKQMDEILKKHNIR